VACSISLLRRASVSVLDTKPGASPSEIDGTGDVGFDARLRGAPSIEKENGPK
jgi:hypothetical protein